MKYVLSLILMLSSSDRLIQEVTTKCQMAYYKYAPSCKFGDSICLSLVLHGLVNKDLFEYQPELRRVYNTPLKQKVYSRTKEYKTSYQTMLHDLKEVKRFEFCSTMDSYWLYDVNHNGFTFTPKSLIPKGRLYNIKNISKVGGYDYIPVSEKDALDIEGWETQSSMKMVFFKLSNQKSGYVDIDLTHFVWFIPHVNYNYEGEIDISYEEGCRTPSFYQYKVGQ